MQMFQALAIQIYEPMLFYLAIKYIDNMNRCLTWKKKKR